MRWLKRFYFWYRKNQSLHTVLKLSLLFCSDPPPDSILAAVPACPPNCSRKHSYSGCSLSASLPCWPVLGSNEKLTSMCRLGKRPWGPQRQHLWGLWSRGRAYGQTCRGRSRERGRVRWDPWRSQNVSRSLGAQSPGGWLWAIAGQRAPGHTRQQNPGGQLVPCSVFHQPAAQGPKHCEPIHPRAGVTCSAPNHGGWCGEWVSQATQCSVPRGPVCPSPCELGPLL